MTHPDRTLNPATCLMPPAMLPEPVLCTSIQAMRTGKSTALHGSDDVQIECAIDLGRTLTESLLSGLSERRAKSPAYGLLLRMDFVMSLSNFLK
jgi:hypothetical protein